MKTGPVLSIQKATGPDYIEIISLAEDQDRLNCFTRSFINKIHPTLPTKARKTKPIKIIGFWGEAGRKGTDAGCTTV